VPREHPPVFDATSASVALLAGALLMSIVWAVHLRDEDASIVDPIWGPAIVLTGLAYSLHAGYFPTGGRLVALLVPLAWAGRLYAHLSARHAEQGEDRRYRKMREARGDEWWWRSFYVVFLLQAALAWVVALPLMALLTSDGDLGVIGALGLVVAGAGYLFEAVADGQLAMFLRRESARRAEEGDAAERRVLDTGLWRYSRHPNYFGEAVVWWGMGLAALAVGAWWALLGPALITFMLLRVSGVTMTESDIGERRPAYREYVERTSAFVPMPPRERAGEG